ncbi:hypothetical protein KCP76_22110 [Salmonella enterica subsp. enterica serovar Weltevreden]|nr:hypothetical protein KCP76_22110 [Salmonella enterica subsp. enterica serovar Weltevreden]
MSSISREKQLKLTLQGAAVKLVVGEPATAAQPLVKPPAVSRCSSASCCSCSATWSGRSGVTDAAGRARGSAGWR